MALSGFLADSLVFCRWNITHYILALFGIRLRLNPGYPVVRNFFPGLIRDSVLEWRVYGGMPLWGLLIAAIDRRYTAPLLLGLWAGTSLSRSRHFRSALAFWRQAALESPDNARNLIRYEEELNEEIIAAVKRGESDETVGLLEQEAWRTQRRVLFLEALRPMTDGLSKVQLVEIVAPHNGHLTVFRRGNRTGILALFCVDCGGAALAILDQRTADELTRGALKAALCSEFDEGMAS